jgi:hypothetical protein
MGALQRARDGIGANEVFEGNIGAPLLRNVLSMRELMPLIGIRTPYTMVPSSFLGMFVLNMGCNEIIRETSRRIRDELVSEILREERYSLRNERKRPWSVRTRRPFRGRLDKVEITFRDKIKLAEMVVREIGPPWKESERGRPSMFDSTKLCAPLLCKGGLSFVNLRGEMRNIGYDATKDGSGRIPSPSYLHYIFDKKIDSEWYERALERLDDLICELYSVFNEKMNTFVIDGSSLMCDMLIEREVAMKRKLIRDTHQYSALVRTHTNTIRGIKRATNRIAPFIPLIPPDSRLILDREYDVEDNYRKAMENDIEIHIRQRKGHILKPGRKRGRRTFSSFEYRKRKLGERHFGNIDVRGHRCHYRKEENRHKGAILIAFEHNMIAYFKSKLWCDMFMVA